ncbi:MAG: DUF2971 domain-containing protein [Gammaproteobacteria bacterium]|nr:DUF2971 domain-containing protein [Gammaproteobacteria bacterium]
MKKPDDPDTFYYYTSLNSVDRKQWFKDILINHKVYFRKRTELNDPLELRPSIIFEGSDKELKHFFRKKIQQYSPIKFSPAKRLIEEKKFIQKYRSSPLLVEEILHELLDKIGIFSFSETPNVPLLWAHYADGYRGAIIEFGSNYGLFEIAQKVQYTNTPPVINRLKDSPSVILDKCMFTKAEHWSYEKEWRVIARWNDIPRTEQFINQHKPSSLVQEFIRSQNGPGCYNIPSESIKGLILGPQIASETEEWIKTLVRESTLPITLTKATLNKTGEIQIPN